MGAVFRLWHLSRGHVVRPEEKGGRRYWRCHYCLTERLRGF